MVVATRASIFLVAVCLGCDAAPTDLGPPALAPPLRPIPPAITISPVVELNGPIAPARDLEDVGFGPVALGASASVSLRLDHPVDFAPPACPASPFCWDGSAVHFSPTELGSATTAIFAGPLEVPVHGFGQPRPLACFDLEHRLRSLGPVGCVDAEIVCVHLGMGEAATVPLEATAMDPGGSGAPAVTVQALGSLEAEGDRAVLPIRVCPRTAGPFEIRFSTPAGTEPAASSVVGGEVKLADEALGAPAELPVGLASELVLLLERIPPGVQARLTAEPRPHPGLRVVRTKIEELFATTARVLVEVVPLAATSAPDALEVELGYGEAFPAVHRLPFLAFDAECRLAVEPSTVDFGTLPLLFEPFPTAVRLTQRGPGTCPIRLPAEAGENLRYGPGFAPDRLQSIDPGQTLVVPLLPEAGARSEIRQASFRFEVPGVGGPQEASVSTRVEFLDANLSIQAASERCRPDRPRRLRLEAGPSPTRIERLELAGDPGFSLMGPELPFTLEPGATAEVRVEYDGRAAHARTELRLEARSGPSSEVARIGLDYGGIETLPRRVDRFRTPGRPQVDLLLVLDGSASFERTEHFWSNLGRFWRFVRAQRLSAQLALLRSDPADPGELGQIPAGLSRNLVPGFEDDDEPALLAAVEATLASPSGQLEQPLAAALAAIGRADWLRPGAVLGLIIVTDEDEQSPFTLEEAQSSLRRVKGLRNTNLFSASTISGGPMGCRDHGVTASPSPRLFDWAYRAGVFEAVCTPDWARSLEGHGDTNWFKSPRYSVTAPPIEATIEVWVDGVLLPARSEDGAVNWAYHSVARPMGDHRIVFAPSALPPAGAEVEVRYAADCR